MTLEIDKEALKFHRMMVAMMFFMMVVGGSQFFFQDGLFSKVVSLIWAGLLLFHMGHFLVQPKTVELAEGTSTIKFTGFLVDYASSIESLRSIEVDHDLVFNFDRKKITMPHRITGLHMLIAKIKAAKPGIEIKGI